MGGMFRIVRTGSKVSGYFNEMLLNTGTFNADPVTRLALVLQNNQTTDATAVTFDNFSATADQIVDVAPPTVAIGAPSAALTAAGPVSYDIT